MLHGGESEMHNNLEDQLGIKKAIEMFHTILYNTKLYYTIGQ